MIGLDTNVLLRAATRDDPVQSPLARAIIGDLSPDQPGVINPAVLVEFAWTLRTGYEYRRAEIADAIRKLLGSRSFLILDRQSVNAALVRGEEDGLDFADALIGQLNASAGCSTTLTFDRKLIGKPPFSQAR